MKLEYESTSQAKSNRENTLLKELAAMKAELDKTSNELISFKKAKEILEREKNTLENQVFFTKKIFF